MVVSLNYCSQNGGNLYRAPYYNGNPNIGPRIIGNLDQSPDICPRCRSWGCGLKVWGLVGVVFWDKVLLGNELHCLGPINEFRDSGRLGWSSIPSILHPARPRP